MANTPPRYFYPVRIAHIILTILETLVLAVVLLSTYLSYPHGLMGDTSASSLTDVWTSLGFFLCWFVLSSIAVINTIWPSRIFSLIELVKPFFLLLFMGTTVLFLLGGSGVAMFSFFSSPEPDILLPILLVCGLGLVLVAYALVSAALPFISFRMIGKMEE